VVNYYNCPDCGDNLRGGRILQNVAANTQMHRIEKAVRGFIHPEQAYLGLWSLHAQLVHQDLGQGRPRRVQQQDIALRRDNPFWHRFGVATLTGNGYSRALVKETHESLAKQTVAGISGFN